MTFRHIRILSAVLPFALAACSNDNEAALDPSGREICIVGVAEANASRASLPLDTDYNMWITAIYHSYDGSAHQYFFNDKLFRYNNMTMTWKSADAELFYPFNGSIDFLAYATANEAHKPDATFSPAALSSSNPSFSSLTLDFGTKLDATDPVVFSDIKPVTCSSSVPSQQLLYRSALSKILFLARTEDAETASRFTIYRLTVKDVKTSGQLQITPNITTEVTIDDKTVTTGSTASWTALYGTAQSLNAYSGSGVHPLCSATEGNAVGNALYLPTQSTPTIDIEIEYTITNATSTTTAHLTKTISLGTVNWLPEMQYTYTLVLNLKQIYVESQVNGAILDSTPEDLDFDEQYHGTTPV